MPSDKIMTYGEEVLRQVAVDVDEFNDEIKALIQHMYIKMVEFRGVGLAGPQVGVSKRIFVYDIGEGPHALINPVVVSSGGEDYDFEGCLSVPGLRGEVPRYTKLVVTGINEDGDKVKIKAQDFLARVFQHEMDHLDGKLFIDRADPDTLETVPQTDDGPDDGEGDE